MNNPFITLSSIFEDNSSLEKFTELLILLINNFKDFNLNDEFELKALNNGNPFQSDKYQANIFDLIIKKISLSNLNQKTQENIKILLDNGLKIKPMIGFDGNKEVKHFSPIYFNADEKVFVFILDYFKNNNLDLKEIEEDNFLLHYAVIKNFKNVIKILLDDFHFDVNKKNREGKTPLMYINNIETLNLLSDYSINAEIKDIYNKTVFNYVKLLGNQEQSDKLFKFLYNNLDKISFKDNDDLSSDSKNNFIVDSLLSAFQADKPKSEITKLLKLYTDKVENIKDADGNNLLMLAFKNQRWAIIDLLLDCYNIDWKQTNNKNEGLLHLCLNMRSIGIKGDPSGTKIKDFITMLFNSNLHDFFDFKNIAPFNLEFFSKFTPINIFSDCVNSEEFTNFIKIKNGSNKSPDLELAFLDLLLLKYGDLEEDYFIKFMLDTGTQSYVNGRDKIVEHFINKVKNIYPKEVFNKIFRGVITETSKDLGKSFIYFPSQNINLIKCLINKTEIDLDILIEENNKLFNNKEFRKSIDYNSLKTIFDKYDLNKNFKLSDTDNKSLKM